MMKEAISMIKKRSPIWTAILSLIVPGLGHVYAGSLRKGLSLIGIQYGVILLAGVFGILSIFYGAVSFIVFSIGFYIFIVISSVKLALGNKEYQLQPYNRWHWYLAIFVAVSVIANVLFSSRGNILGYETYRIPAKSMVPTLQIGDFITVNTRYQQPKVGDVIVFLYPKDRSIPYVKRVAAVSNDTVLISNGIVIRNGKPENALLVPESKRLKNFSISMKERKVPENELFFLGDWRDNSNDSRFWGTVPVADVIGKVTYIWFSKDVNRIGKSVE
ncbi:MAG: signal peptidase I [Gammaproteobacteria bacterium]|nr:signal peptidase I [Gammaproteobacteria bacterium]MCF6261205.1 signal peptidase I [Gammaproteobacteria bacterium]